MMFRNASSLFSVLPLEWIYVNSFAKRSSNAALSLLPNTVWSSNLALAITLIVSFDCALIVMVSANNPIVNKYFILITLSRAIPAFCNDHIYFFFGQMLAVILSELHHRGITTGGQAFHC